MKLINQLSKETGTPIHTVRYYEKYGLFKGKKDGSVKTNNYTWYDDEVVEKLELIKEAKAIGFSLAEIKKLLDAWYSKRLSVEKKKEVLLQKMAEIEGKIQQLTVMKAMIEEGIRDVEAFNC